MGSYYGHVVPGLVIAAWGIAWLFLTFVAHLHSKRSRSDRDAGRNDLGSLRWVDGYKHRSWLPLPCAPRVPIEPVCKICIASLGMFVELFVEMANHETTFYWHVTNIFHRPPGVEKAQHATMYSFFILSGIMDLVTMGGCCRFPKKTGQIIFALALWVEGTLFMFHTGGRSMLDSRVHFILALTIYGAALAATARIVHPTKVLVNLVLSVSLIFQGTWLVAIGFFLYGPNKMWWVAENDMSNEHDYVMLASLMAAWHLLCIVVVVLFLWGVVMTLSHCGIKVLLPLVHVPGVPASLKDRLHSAARASQSEDVLYERTGLMERGTLNLNSGGEETDGEIGDHDGADMTAAAAL